MATTYIQPVKAGKRRTPKQTLGDTLDYVSNPEKTTPALHLNHYVNTLEYAANPEKTQVQVQASADNMEADTEHFKELYKELYYEDALVATYQCGLETAAAEFLLSKSEYEFNTGRKQPVDRDVLMYGLRVSFKPGEITPEAAHKLGYQIAMDFTGGKHAFLLGTHLDKPHIHCHIYFNAINLESNGKFRNEKWSYLKFRDLVDSICQENNLSVIMEPNMGSKDYGEWSISQRAQGSPGAAKSPSNRAESVDKDIYP